MKKLLFIILLLITTLSGYAKVKISGGPKVGINIASLTKNSDSKASIGVLAGGFLNLRFSPLFALQPELLFSMQGNKEKIWETDEGGTLIDYFTISQKLNYLQIPIMAKFYTIKNFYLEAGPEFGILLNAKFGDNKINDFVRKGDISLGFGLGYDWAFGLTANFRYNIGLLKTTKFFWDDDYKHRNSVAQFSLGWQF